MRHITLSCLALGSLLWWPGCEAALDLMRTRLIYAGGASEASLMVHNQGEAPTLLQAWVDGGDEQQGPADVSTPFLVLPPMMRLGPDKGQALRVLGADLRALPRDRESLFWLNVLGLPPKAASAGGSVQLAYRTRIKLFYRPAGLAGSAAGAAERLIWHELAGTGLRVTNPTPFHVSLSEVLLEARGQSFSWHEAGVIPPYGILPIPMPGAALAGARGRLRWIDDDGNYHEQGFVLNQQGGR
ncbi:molecular chaperone [Aeromonas sp. sia0103]|uniref:fimbrial biogenesis chaperone n=1 Tax=Aeromonas sp. sia0103 TaxID=2854782 RepID=UPI000FACC5E0|nr:molecular chaperone [Aeromonas sp. sia0103]MBV7596416.1 molecular chaperone [Aeromonas sp. sia0103]